MHVIQVYHLFKYRWSFGVVMWELFTLGKYTLHELLAKINYFSSPIFRCNVIIILS